MSKQLENICHAFISGNLARDAEMRYSNSGLAICNFTVVANTNKKKGEEWESYANFFDCTIFGRTAESLHRFLVKGKLVFIDGRLEQQRWETEGTKRSKVVILPEKIMLGGEGKPKADHDDDVAPWEKASGEEGDGDFQDDVPF